MSKHSIINEGAADTDQPIGAINVTSLVDVMLCLLIMFMAATPLMTPKGGGNVTLPAGRGDKITQDEFNYGVISVDKKGNVFLGTAALDSDPDKLQQQLANNVKLKDDGMVFLQGDQNADYSRIVDVLVALKAANISKVGFVTDPDMRKLEGPAQ